MTFVIDIADPLVGSRVSEPVVFIVPAELPAPLYWARLVDGTSIPCQRLSVGSGSGQTAFIACLSFSGKTQLTLGEPLTDAEIVTLPGIRVAQGREADCFARLDTGAFDLELCSGTAEGTGASKWGLRHFKGLADGFELLPSGNNAIGGFYGPFFTPENGLINPPEHTKVDIEIIERGPLLHHYRMRGVIPDGLLPELRGKHFAIDWRFTYGTPYFQRRYEVDDFQTVINGRSVTNKITVGDEFEGGPGELVFDRFAAYGGTRYRSGDPYAGLLVDMVGNTLAEAKTDNPKFAELRNKLRRLDEAHWDLYWRLFSAWEKALPDPEISARLARVRAAAHVAADLNDRAWRLTDQPVDVSTVPHETIFPGPASKTAEFHAASGRTMVWWTSAPSGAFQIVQRRQSGWVNWGSNGENECPELPVGVDIKTAYGPFADNWQIIADQLETAPSAAVRLSP